MLKIDLSNVEFTHCRLAKKREQDIKLKSSVDAGLDGIKDIGTAKDDEKERLSVVIKRLNGIFGTKFTGDDLVNYAETIAGKILEDSQTHQQMMLRVLEDEETAKAFAQPLPKVMRSAQRKSGLR